MKQKYVISRNNETSEIVIKELGETDPTVFSILCEQRYSEEELKAKAEAGKFELIDALRNNDFYPPDYFINLLADKLIEIFNGDEPASDNIRIEFNDLDALAFKKEVEEEEVEEETIDDLLDDDSDDDSIIGDLGDTDVLDV